MMILRSAAARACTHDEPNENVKETVARLAVNTAPSNGALLFLTPESQSSQTFHDVSPAKSSLHCHNVRHRRNCST
jgi:hypothetical protein